MKNYGLTNPKMLPLALLNAARFAFLSVLHFMIKVKKKYSTVTVQ